MAAGVGWGRKPVVRFLPARFEMQERRQRREGKQPWAANHACGVALEAKPSGYVVLHLSGRRITAEELLWRSCRGS